MLRVTFDLHPGKAHGLSGVKQLSIGVPLRRDCALSPGRALGLVSDWPLQGPRSQRVSREPWVRPAGCPRPRRALIFVIVYASRELGIGFGSEEVCILTSFLPGQRLIINRFYLSVPVSVSPCLCSYLCLSLSLSVSPPVSLSPHLCLSVSPVSVSPCLCPSLSLLDGGILFCLFPVYQGLGSKSMLSPPAYSLETMDPPNLRGVLHARELTRFRDEWPRRPVHD